MRATPRSTSFAIWGSFLAALSGCELGARTVGYEPLDAIEPGVERELTRAGPCGIGERSLIAADPSGSVGLFVNLLDPVRKRPLAGTYAIADDEATVMLSRGTNVFSDWCNRNDEWGAPDIEEWWATSRDASQHGTVEIELDPGAARESLELATVTLVDITLRRKDIDGEPDIVIDELVMPR